MEKENYVMEGDQGFFFLRMGYLAFERMRRFIGSVIYLILVHMTLSSVNLHLKYLGEVYLWYWEVTELRKDRECVSIHPSIYQQKVDKIGM